ncbi:MAG: PKD-like domain-containing protein [Janthinobacterium lividum]
MEIFYYKLQKVLFLMAFFTLFSTLSKAQTLTLSSIDAGPYTPGSSIAVPFNINTSSGCINTDNVFKLYISSVPGGTPDTEIGSYTGFYTAFLNGTIPSGLAAGSYNLAVKSSDPVVTSATASINIVAGTAVQAGLDGSSINSDNPQIFGNCSGTNQPYDFINTSTSGASATADFYNEYSQNDEGTFTLNPSKSFSAAYANYTILVKAIKNGTEATKAYQLINNKLNTSFGTTGTNTVCLNNGMGQLSYTVDYTSPNGIQFNYPGNLYIVDWGDGSPQSIYTLCDIKNMGGVLSHSYTQSSCGSTSGNQANSFQVNAQVSSRVCGTLGSPITSYAKVVRPPTNSFTAPLSACLNEPVTFNNTSDPGQDASSANCVNNNAKYSWYIDGSLVAVNQPAGTSFTYTFTTSGQHTVKLVLQSQSGSVCSASDVIKNICVLAKPQPAFTVSSATICSNSSITITDNSVTDQACPNIPQNNAYTWSVTGPGNTVFINGTTASSHQPQIQFTTPGPYTITLSIGTESCGAVTTSQNIVVNTTPTVSLSPDKNYCGTNITLSFSSSAGPTQTIFSGTTSQQTNTYTWNVSGGNYSYQNGTTANSQYPVILFSDFATYTITATHQNNCGTATATQNISFKQSPTISAGPDQTVCPDVNVQLAGTITGPTPQSYQWTGGTGTFSPDRNTLNAVYTPSNAETNAGMVTLTLVVATGNPSPCDQLTDDVVITINPRNGVTSSSAKSICTGNSVGYHPTAQQTGSTFTWTSTVINGSISGNSASGSGDITDVLTDNDPQNSGTVTYTITPVSNGCPGTAFALTVTVTPRPIITVNSTTNTICSGQGAGITFSSNLSGTTFKWTTTATSNVYGNNSQSAGNFTGINEVLTNTSATTSGTVTYTITPISSSGCEGTPVTVTITVQPLPVQADAGPDQQICSVTTTTLSGNSPGVSTGLWTLRSGQSGVSFTDATQYNTVVNGVQAGQIYTFRWTITGAAQCNSTFDEVTVTDLSPLTNNISFGNPAVCYGQTITIIGDQPSGGTGTYVYSWQSSTDNVNWTTISGQSGRDYSFTGTQSTTIRRIVTSGACSSSSSPVSIVVQPAIANNTIAANQVICYSTAPAQLTGSTPTGADNNYIYQWQSSTDNGTTWLGISGSNTQNYQPTALTAATQFRRVVTSALCNGAQQNISNVVTITVNAQNTNTVTSDASRVICTNTTLNYQPTAQQTGTVFTWVSSASANVTGNTASGSGNISDLLINSDPSNNGTVTYTITPINNACPGTPFTLTVTVTPIPRVIITHSGGQICSGQPTGITFTTNVPGVLLKWTSDDMPGIYGNNDQVTPVIATRVDDVLSSGITTPATIVYHITPVSPGGCTGPTVDASVTVLPIPVTANAGADAQICNASTYTLNGNNAAPSTGKWTLISGQTSVVFADDTQSNTAVSGLQPGQNYTFRWTITSTGGCATSTDDVTISDLADLTNNISFSSPAVCYGQMVTIAGDQPTGGTGSFVYTWESSTDGNTWTSITGQSSRFYTFTATQNIYLRRIVTSGPCTKISNVIQLLVQPPIANNTIAADQTICYNNTPVVLSGSTPTGGDGNFIYQWQQSNDNGASWNTISGANSINYQPVALMTTMQFRRIVTTGLCTGDQQNISNLVTITVTPQNTNTVTSANSVAICTGTSVAYHPTAQAADTVFTWVSSASASVSGNAASGMGDINDVLVNADPTANGTVTYTITPINNNCPGAPFILMVNVTPRPILSVNTTANTICSGQPIGITFSANLSGTTFKWTSNASAGIYGNNNQQPVFASRIDDVLTNTSATTAGTATYVITPIGPSGCEGTPVTVTITVQPAAVQANAGPDAQICSATEYILKGNDPGIAAGRWITTSGQTVIFADPTRYNTTVSGLLPGQQYTFRWTITGAAQCTATSDDVVITDLESLTNNVSFAGPVCYGQTVTITGDQSAGGTGSFVYAWEISTDNNTWTVVTGQTSRNYTFTGIQTVYVRRTVTSGPCTNVSQPVLVTVQPALSNNSVSADQVICYNNMPAALNGSTPAGADGNFIYQWQQSMDGGSTWSNINGANGVNYQPNALSATTQFRRVVTSALCTGSQQSISNGVIINVTPQNTNTVTSDASRVICTGTTFSYHPTAQQGNTVFTWVSSATATISGNSASGSGDIHEVLTNSDPNNNGTVTYTITPINNNCPGIPFTLTVTVTPTPTVTITHDGNRICSGNPTGITFITNNPDVLLKWTFDRVQGIKGANDQYPVKATRIDDILSSELTTEATIIYHITPISPGGCAGQTVDATVTVLPLPITANAGPDEQICSTNNYTFKGNNPAPSTGAWTVTSGQLGVGFADASQYNTTVNGLQPGQTYTFRWTITSPGNCNSTTDEVTIADLKAITNNISYANPAVCYGQTVTITGDQPTGGTGSFVYAWEISVDNSSWTTVVGEAGASYSFTGTQSVYIRRVITSGPCTSISAPVFITVQQPITNNTVATDQQVCYNSAPALMTGSAPAGADSRYVYQWQSSTDNSATWTNISGANLQVYQSGSLIVSTWFRRVVSSILCTGPQQSISNIIKMTVNPLPVAAYTFTNDLACIPFTITAQNIKATASDANNTYAWYADGTLIGTGLTFPGYTITTDDAHVEIKLVATSKYGCPDAVFTHVFSTIKEVKAGFTQNQTKGCGPLTVTFSNASSPQNLATYSWNFGNGSTSTQVNPGPVTYVARTDGKDTTYTITLKAMTTCGIRTATSTVLVRPKPISIFTPDKTTGCSPLTVNFNNTSPGTGNTYTYDFGDGTTLVTQDNQPVNHTYIAANNKTFTVKMTAQNECGISVTSYKISISPNTVLPQLIVNGDQKAGCAPWTVNFYNNTKGGNYFTYDFGDGTKLSSVSAPEVVSHTFLKDGTYNVIMRATNGCSDTSASQSITVYPQPVVAFVADVRNGCTQLTVNFTNKTAGNNTYLWDFGDGSTSVTANPAHTFQSRSTPYTISLIAKNLLGCPDTLVMKDYISVTIPPKAAFRANPDSVIVYPHYSFSFKDQSTNLPILWKWNFGDGSNSSKQNPEHTYADTGRYKVKLVVYNLQGCADTITHIVQITGIPGQLFVPNAFMPTSKFEELRTFKVKGSGIKTWRMRVFNKWGQVIWESTKLTERGEPAEGWDGMMGGAPAPQGVYFWQVEAKYLNGGDWEGMSYNGSTPSRTGVIHLIQ